MVITKRDVELHFYVIHTGHCLEERVAIMLGGGASETFLTLQEFSELMADARKEIAGRHWQSCADDAQSGGAELTT